MESIYRNNDGKVSTAAYYCEIRTRRTDLFTEEWVGDLFPRAFGRSISMWNFVVRPLVEVRWNMLIANETQTTPEDIRTRIQKYWPLATEPNFTVVMMAGVAERGSASPRASSSRLGTRRRMTNNPPYVGVAAK